MMGAIPGSGAPNQEKMAEVPAKTQKLPQNPNIGSDDLSKPTAQNPQYPPAQDRGFPH